EDVKIRDVEIERAVHLGRGERIGRGGARLPDDELDVVALEASPMRTQRLDEDGNARQLAAALQREPDPRAVVGVVDLRNEIAPDQSPLLYGCHRAFEAEAA